MNNFNGSNDDLMVAHRDELNQKLDLLNNLSEEVTPFLNKIIEEIDEIIKNSDDYLGIDTKHDVHEIGSLVTSNFKQAILFSRRAYTMITETMSLIDGFLTGLPQEDNFGHTVQIATLNFVNEVRSRIDPTHLLDVQSSYVRLLSQISNRSKYPTNVLEMQFYAHVAEMTRIYRHYNNLRYGLRQITNTINNNMDRIINPRRVSRVPYL